jgi:ferredoxin
MTTAPKAYKLTVDAEKCQGHNRCHVLAPELIVIDELGYAGVRNDGRVAPELAEKARLAVRNCPEFALRLEPIDREGDAP